MKKKHTLGVECCKTEDDKSRKTNVDYLCFSFFNLPLFTIIQQFENSPPKSTHELYVKKVAILKSIG